MTCTYVSLSLERSAHYVGGYHVPRSSPAAVEGNCSKVSNSPSKGDSEDDVAFTAPKKEKALSSQCRGLEERLSVVRRAPSPLTIDHDSHRYLDPFHTYPSNLSRETITRTFHYCRYPPQKSPVTLLIHYSYSRNVAETIPRPVIQGKELYPRVDAISPKLPTPFQRMASLRRRAPSHPAESIWRRRMFYDREGYL